MPGFQVTVQVRTDDTIGFNDDTIDIAAGLLAEQTGSVAAARYHDESAPDGRAYRVVVLSHPRPQEPPEHE